MLPASRPALYTAAPSASAIPAEPFPSQIWGDNWRGRGTHCGSRSDPVHSSTTAGPRPHCSRSSVSSGIKQARLAQGQRFYLAFEVDGSGADEVTVIVSLLHSRRWLSSHHGLVRGAFLYYLLSPENCQIPSAHSPQVFAPDDTVSRKVQGWWGECIHGRSRLMLQLRSTKSKPGDVVHEPQPRKRMGKSKPPRKVSPKIHSGIKNGINRLLNFKAALLWYAYKSRYERHARNKMVVEEISPKSQPRD
jgi:hypothetical protein